MSLTLEQWLAICTLMLVVVMLVLRAGAWSGSIGGPKAADEAKRVRDRLHTLSNEVQRASGRIDSLESRVSRSEQDIQKLFNGNLRK